jgi:hypothetical protein
LIQPGRERNITATIPRVAIWPITVWGEWSPYPTVDMVMKMNQMQVQNERNAESQLVCIWKEGGWGFVFE